MAVARIGRSKPLRIFICAADEASDQAGAALVAALKQLHGKQLTLSGVGGPLLQAQGLECVVTDEQMQQLATAEVVPPVYSLQKLHGISQVSKTAYLKIFRDTIWEAAFAGCGSYPKPQQQQQAPDGSSTSSTSSSTSSSQQPHASRQRFDAVVTIGSPTAGQLVLEALRAAERAKKAKLPVLVQYMAPGLWDYHESAGVAKRLSKLADHVMCSLPFEPPVLHAAGTPASFVGHPVVQQLLEAGHFSGRRQVVVQLIQQMHSAAAAAAAAAGGQQQQQQQQQELPVVHQQLFTQGNAPAFWQVFDSLYASQHPTTNGDSVVDHSSRNSAAKIQKDGTTRPKSVQQAKGQQQQQQQRLLLTLLPGSTEAEVVNSMAALDQVTRGVLEAFPELVAAMIVPDMLLESAVAATNNFTLPVIVVPAGSQLAASALAAAAAAVSHPGHDCLWAVAAGLPLVCVRDGSLLRAGWSKWRRRELLPYGCIPNLLLGRAVVPEFNLWQRGGLQSAVQAVQQVLEEARSTAGAPGAAVQTAAVVQQQAALQDVLLRLVPAQVGGTSGAAAASGTVAVQSPAEAAARALLELIDLRQQHEAQQLMEHQLAMQREQQQSSKPQLQQQVQHQGASAA